MALAFTKFLKFSLHDPKTYSTGLEQARRPEGALQGVPVIAALLFWKGVEIGSNAGFIWPSRLIGASNDFHR
jgi:hypothetical protein